ncbi:hypothetical protein [Rhizobium altiplani]|uniref:hypothetical protein n=1 Tax=Rhizobium altiplani TaxID=1864509 RepID=UPI00196A1889
MTFVLATIRGRSNYERAAKIANTSRPLAVVVSIDASSPASTLIPIFRLLRSSIRLRQITPETVGFSEHYRIAATQSFEAGFGAGPIISAATAWVIA